MSAQHIVMLSFAATCFLLAKESLAGTQIFIDEPSVVAAGSDLATLEPPEPPQPARIHIRSDHDFLRDSTTSLNRFTFGGNVLRAMEAPTSNWVVFYSADWDEKCQQLLPSYRAIGTKMSAELNAGSLMSAVVRFAVVGCDTDKELCNAQAIDRYPTVVHYRGGQRMSEWTGGSPGLLPFLKHGLLGTPLPGQGRKRSQRPGSVVRRQGQDTPVDGDWDQGAIRGRTLTLKSGDTLDLAIVSSTKVKTTLNNDVAEGELRSDGKLYWNNGDVWTRALQAEQTLPDAERAASPACCSLAGLPCSTMSWGSFQTELPAPFQCFGGFLVTLLAGLVLAPLLFPGICSRRHNATRAQRPDVAAVAAAGDNGVERYLPADWAHERRSIVL